MELEKFVEIVEDMALQHDYPGFEIRSLKLGLPQEALKSPAKMFAAALRHENVVVKLAALRWFWDKPGVAGQYVKVIAACLGDADEWVRLEAVRCLERMHVEETHVLSIAGLLSDPSACVRKAAAKACGKLGCKSEAVIAALKVAAEDSDIEVRWKAQKALRMLGAYVA